MSDERNIPELSATSEEFSPIPPSHGVMTRYIRISIAAVLIFLASLALMLGFLIRRRQSVALPANRLVITVLNVDQGEAAWIRTPNGKIILIGGGPPSAGKEIIESLRDAGASAIDLLLMPYPYAEAIGGLPDILKTLPVNQVLETSAGDINAWQKQVHNLLDQRHIRVKIARAGQVWNIDGVQLEVLAPADPLLQNAPVAANNSLVARIVYGQTRFLFMGGVEKAGENALLTRAPDLSANWLRVARFGTREASSPELLRLVHPDIIVLSVGPNRDNLPHPETLTRLAATGASLYRTDRQISPLRFISDGTFISSPP
jgi:competence protein ComEC